MEEINRNLEVHFNKIYQLLCQNAVDAKIFNGFIDEFLKAVIYIKSDEYIRTLEGGINWHNESMKETQEYIKQKDMYIQKLEGGINWHFENEKKMQNDFQKREQEMQDLIIRLRRDLCEIEKSFSYRVTKFLRRKKEGQGHES